MSDLGLEAEELAAEDPVVRRSHADRESPRAREEESEDDVRAHRKRDKSDHRRRRKTGKWPPVLRLTWACLTK